MQTRNYAPPRITYVDDDDNNPTLKLPALSKRTTTLNPLASEPGRAELGRDEPGPVTTRELRVRRVARWFIGSVVVMSTVVLAAGYRIAREQHFTLGAAHKNRAKTTGEFLAPDSNETVFVDDTPAGRAPDTLTIPCGLRRIRLGDKGTTRSIDIPCGGRVTL